MTTIEIDQDAIDATTEQELHHGMGLVFLTEHPIAEVLAGMRAVAPHASPLLDGIALPVAVYSLEQLPDQVARLVAALESAGFAGRLTIRKPFDTMTTHRDPPMVKLGVALRAAPKDPENPESSPLVADEARTKSLVELSAAWCAAAGGRLLFGSRRSDLVDGPEDLIRLCGMGGDGVFEGWTMTAVSAEGADVPTILRSVSSHVDRTLAQFKVGLDDWEAELAELTDVARRLAPDLHHAWMIGRRTHNGFDVNDVWGLGFEHKPPMMFRQQVPDKVGSAAGLQILGSDLVGQIHGDDWTVTDLGGGARLVAHHDPEAWFAREPTFELLRDAYVDFHDLVAHPEWVPTRPEPEPITLREADQAQLSDWYADAFGDEPDGHSLVQIARHAQQMARHTQGLLRKHLGSPEGFWKAWERSIAEGDVRGVLDFAALAILAEFPGAPDGLDVDPTVLGPVGRHLDAFDQSFMVVTEQIDEAMVALARASARISCVGDNGHEHTDAEMEDFESDVYTPNYVGDPEPVEGGVRLYLDTKSVMWAPMLRTIIRIVLDELESAGVRRARITPVPEGLHG